MKEKRKKHIKYSSLTNSSRVVTKLKASETRGASLLTQSLPLSVLPIISSATDEMAPSVFISYSHASEKHKEWVAFLARKLSRLGIKVNYDANVDGSETFYSFMESLTNNKFVICVLSESYVKKENDNTPGGVVSEINFIKAKNLDEMPLEKFVIPVLKDSKKGDFKDKVPKFLRLIKCYDFDNEGEAMKSFMMIARRILAMEDKIRSKILPSAQKHYGEDVTAQDVSDCICNALASYWNEPLGSPLEVMLKNAILSGNIFELLGSKQAQATSTHTDAHEIYKEKDVCLFGRWDFSYSGDQDIFNFLTRRPDDE